MGGVVRGGVRFSNLNIIYITHNIPDSFTFIVYLPNPTPPQHESFYFLIVLRPKAVFKRCFVADVRGGVKNLTLPHVIHPTPHAVHIIRSKLACRNMVSARAFQHAVSARAACVFFITHVS